MEGTVPSPRTPEEDDLIKLCAALNSQGSKYIVIGGMAMNQHGMLRATEDIDLLVESSRENQEKVRRALEVLPDKAVREMAESDLDSFTVVRVADEVVVDLMLAACGITYDQAVNEIEIREVGDVSIPFPSARLLLRMKQTYRDKDIADRMFLQHKLEGES
jgi:Nucleotidyl transferase AbiEii toxin, Type IV TA system